MVSISRLTGFGFLGLLLFTTGCANNKQSARHRNALQAQVGVITEELVRLDESLQEVRAAIQNEHNRLLELESEIISPVAQVMRAEDGVSVKAGIYRTPSGFELPSRGIQEALSNAGYYDGRVDGKIGPRTRDSVKAFQRDHNLEVDGVVGQQTWSKLKVYAGQTIK